MPDTPTPAPALTDEQIEALTRDVLCAGPTMRAWYAAVIDRAKREAAEEIADELNRRAMRAEIDRLPGLAATYSGLIPIARRIGGHR